MEPYAKHGKTSGFEKKVTMTDTSISMKSIEDLQHNPEDSNKPYRFFVPSYQRGYRWGKEEVSALMDDLSVFFDTQTIHHDYCLQPIVVKPRKTGHTRLSTDNSG